MEPTATTPTKNVDISIKLKKSNNNNNTEIEIETIDDKQQVPKQLQQAQQQQQTQTQTQLTAKEDREIEEDIEKEIKKIKEIKETTIDPISSKVNSLVSYRELFNVQEIEQDIFDYGEKVKCIDGVFGGIIDKLHSFQLDIYTKLGSINDINIETIQSLKNEHDIIETFINKQQQENNNNTNTIVKPTTPPPPSTLDKEEKKENEETMKDKDNKDNEEEEDICEIVDISSPKPIDQTLTESTLDEFIQLSGGNKKVFINFSVDSNNKVIDAIHSMIDSLFITTKTTKEYMYTNPLQPPKIDTQQTSPSLLPTTNPSNSSPNTTIQPQQQLQQSYSIIPYNTPPTSNSSPQQTPQQISSPPQQQQHPPQQQIPPQQPQRKFKTYNEVMVQSIGNYPSIGKKIEFHVKLLLLLYKHLVISKDVVIEHISLLHDIEIAIYYTNRSEEVNCQTLPKLITELNPFDILTETSKVFQELRAIKQQEHLLNPVVPLSVQQQQIQQQWALIEKTKQQQLQAEQHLQAQQKYIDQQKFILQNNNPQLIFPTPIQQQQPFMYQQQQQQQQMPMQQQQYQSQFQQQVPMQHVPIQQQYIYQQQQIPIQQAQIPIQQAQQLHQQILLFNEQIQHEQQHLLRRSQYQQQISPPQQQAPQQSEISLHQQQFKQQVSNFRTIEQDLIIKHRAQLAIMNQSHAKQSVQTPNDSNLPAAQKMQIQKLMEIQNNQILELRAQIKNTLQSNFKQQHNSFNSFNSFNNNNTNTNINNNNNNNNGVIILSNTSPTSSISSTTSLNDSTNLAPNKKVKLDCSNNTNNNNNNNIIKRETIILD